MSRNAQPIVFFAFANDRAEGVRYLRNLPEEQRNLRRAMAAAPAEVVERGNATADEIFDVFQHTRYRDRVAVFHFGGHAGSAELILENSAGRSAVAHAGGLAALLREQRGLALVFLNGCSSRGQARGLLEAGVRAVIGTSHAIDDAVATDFSARFYQSLASGATIRRAFKEAEATVRTKRGDQPRDLYRERSLVPQRSGEQRWPWELHVADGADRWSLPQACGGRVDVPPLLPYMSDRSRQRDQLADAVADHRHERPRRPLAVLIHGDERQAHEAFVQLLQAWILPALLRLDEESEPVRRFRVEWSDPRGTFEVRRRELERRLAEALTERRDAGRREMAREVARHRAPVMITSTLASSDWQGHEPELVRAWLELFTGWPDLPPGQLMLLILCFREKAEARRGLARLLFWKRKGSERTEKLVAQLAPTRELGIIALDRLGSIGENDVTTWIEKHAGDFVRSAGGPVCDPLILAERLTPAVRELFAQLRKQGRESMPMEALAKELRMQLDRCLNEGGS